MATIKTLPTSLREPSSMGHGSWIEGAGSPFLTQASDIGSRVGGDEVMCYRFKTCPVYCKSRCIINLALLDTKSIIKM